MPRHRPRPPRGIANTAGAIGGLLLLGLLFVTGLLVDQIWTAQSALDYAVGRAARAEAAVGCWTPTVSAAAAQALQARGLTPNQVSITAATTTLTTYGNPVAVGLRLTLPLSLGAWHLRAPIQATTEISSRYLPGISTPDSCSPGPGSLSPPPASPPATGTPPFPLRVVYAPSSAYPAVDWVQGPSAAVAALEQHGYTGLGAQALAQWLQTATANGDAPYSQVVLPQDPLAAPLAPAETGGGPLDAYLNSGGTVLVMGDIPAYYQEASGGSLTPWGPTGEHAVLGLPSYDGPAWVPPGQPATPTAAGAAWGLTNWAGSLRPMAPQSALTPLATDTIPWTAWLYQTQAGWFQPAGLGTYGEAGDENSGAWAWSNIPTNWPDPFATAIWSTYTSPPNAEPGMTFYRTALFVPATGPVTFWASADDEINQVWIDGATVPALDTTSWSADASTTLTLTSGWHSLAVEATNLGSLPNPARLLFAAYSGLAPETTAINPGSIGPVGSTNTNGVAYVFWRSPSLSAGSYTVAYTAPPSDTSGCNDYGLVLTESNGQTVTVAPTPSAWQVTGPVGWDSAAGHGTWINLSGSGSAVRTAFTVPSGVTAVASLAIPPNGYWNNEPCSVTISGPLLMDSATTGWYTTGYTPPAPNVWDAAWVASYPHGGRFVRLWDFPFNWAQQPALVTQLTQVASAVGTAVSP